jgi:Holliday junction resolvase
MVALQNVDCVALEKTLVDVVIVEAKERTEETIEVTLEEILPFSS